MGDWNRSTRECTPASLPVEFTAAVQKHIEQYNLGLTLSDASMCIESTARKIKRGLFARGAETVTMGVILTPGWLIWAIRGESPEVAVMSARLGDIVVQDYGSTQFAKMVPDSGLEVSGSFTGVSEKGSAFIGLDNGPLSQGFRALLLRLVQAAKA
jgi:hypothetical protein